MQYKVGDRQTKPEQPIGVRESAESVIIEDIVERVVDKIKLLRWGKIELIVRDAKVTQINTVDEERL